MYGEYCVTKLFSNADDIRLSINSMLEYTTYVQQREKKDGKIKQTTVYCWSMQFIIFYFFVFL